MLRADEIAAKLEAGFSEIDKPEAERDDEKELDRADPFIIIPAPDLEALRKSGSASIDLRLGCWFSTLKKANVAALDVDAKHEQRFSEERHVPLGEKYFIHPRSFVLAVTLEWIRLPMYLAGYIHGKSSWGRCGLVIATASVIHPGFTGCITLELANFGDAPIAIAPGMKISQLCLHNAAVQDQRTVDKSKFSGQRKPLLRDIELDDVATILMDRQYC